MAFIVAGSLVVSLIVWLTVNTSRRRQRRRWLGAAEDAEALPEDVFIRPNDAYAGF